MQYTQYMILVVLLNIKVHELLAGEHNEKSDVTVGAGSVHAFN